MEPILWHYDARRFRWGSSCGRYHIVSVAYVNRPVTADLWCPRGKVGTYGGAAAAMDAAEADRRGK